MSLCANSCVFTVANCALEPMSVSIIAVKSGGAKTPALLFIISVLCIMSFKLELL